MQKNVDSRSFFTLLTRHKMKKIGFLIPLLLLSGCANFVWERGGITPLDLQRDKAQCEYEVSLASEEMQQEHSIDLCMTEKGYTKRQIASPPSSVDVSIAQHPNSVDATNSVAGCAAWLATFAAADTSIAFRKEINEWDDFGYVNKLTYDKKVEAHPLSPLVMALTNKSGGSGNVNIFINQAIRPEFRKMRLKAAGEHPGKQKAELTIYLLPQIKKKTEAVCEAAGEHDIKIITISDAANKQNQEKPQTAPTPEKSPSQTDTSDEPQMPSLLELLQKLLTEVPEQSPTGSSYDSPN